MRNILAIAALVAIAALGSASVTAECGAPDVSYQQFAPGAPAGMLTFTDAEGRHFVAYDSHNMIVQTGVVGGPQWEEFCPNSGPDYKGQLLKIHLEPDTWFVIDDPEDWHWD